MRKIFKKNQIIITAMAGLVAVAGYLSYSQEGTDGDVNTVKDVVDADAEMESGEEETGEKQNDDTKPGEAVLVSTQGMSDFVINAKLKREQVRAENKEDLLEVVNNVNVTEEDKEVAVNKMVELADITEKELAAETLIMSKGFNDVVVNKTGDNVEVILGVEKIDNIEKTQIEDIVKRKMDVEASNITISFVSSK